MRLRRRASGADVRGSIGVMFAGERGQPPHQRRRPAEGAARYPPPRTGGAHHQRTARVQQRWESRRRSRRQDLRSPAPRQVAATHCGRGGNASSRLAGYPARRELTLAGLEQGRHTLQRRARGRSTWTINPIRSDATRRQMIRPTFSGNLPLAIRPLPRRIAASRSELPGQAYRVRRESNRRHTRRDSTRHSQADALSQATHRSFLVPSLFLPCSFL